jgi:hypothetical protein
MRSMHNLTRSQLCCLAVLGACSTPPARRPDAASGQNAIAHFHAALAAEQFKELPVVLAELDAADAATPNDPSIVLARGLANVWGVAEVERDPAQASTIPARARQAIASLTQAQQLRPNDPRVLGWLGANLMGAGAATHDPKLIAQGRQVLAAGVASDPEFNLFVEALVDQEAPASDPRFAAALEAYYRTLDLCIGGKLDRDAPDMTPYLGHATQTGSSRVCWNVELAPHNFEGFFLHMGDALAKAGRTGAARVAYRDATLLPSYTTWPFHDLLAARLANVDARVALYTDADPSNDPPLVGETQELCATCHAH